MPKVIVTVVNAANKDTRDFEIPSGMKVLDVAGGLAEAFDASPDARYQLEAFPLGRALEPHESLESAGIWDGSLLVLLSTVRKSVDAPMSKAAVNDSGSSRGPVTGWRALDAVLPKPEEVPEKAARQSRDFVWKRLD